MSYKSSVTFTSLFEIDLEPEPKKMSLLKLLLFPFSILYGLVISFRNFLFDKKIISSKNFDLPIINLGNIVVGGTGKTPHVEYLIRLLQNNYRLATLSRGYKRETEGYRVANTKDNVRSIGDEPSQFKFKFPNTIVTVDEDRPRGVRNLLREDNAPQVIILDDAYQHRYISPSLNILLTEFGNLYSNDHLLPVGRLRESRKGASRADVVIVTKSPQYLSPIDERYTIEKLNLKKHQTVFFSYLEYCKIWNIKTKEEISIGQFKKVILVTGIVNPLPIRDFLEENRLKVSHLEFADHHNFSKKDILKIKKAFDDIYTKDAIILTTEKDAMRLINSSLLNELGVPVFAIEIQVAFHNQKAFDKLIEEHVAKNSRNSKIP